jgi:hypothetical protein
VAQLIYAARTKAGLPLPQNADTVLSPAEAADLWPAWKKADNERRHPSFAAEPNFKFHRMTWS